MKKIALSVALSAAMMATLAAKPASVTGTYVEARTAEVFAGACIMNGEAATAGREALLAWKVDHGQVNGVALDGLAVVAAIASTTNLGIHEIGGESTPARAVLYTDARATDAQRKALVTMVKSLSGKDNSSLASDKSYEELVKTVLGVSALITGSQQAVETRRSALESAGQEIGSSKDIKGSIDQNTQLQVQTGLTLNEMIGTMNAAVQSLQAENQRKLTDISNTKKALTYE